MRRKYAIQILTFPETHPIRQHCPSTFPPFYETPESSNRNGPWISWDSWQQNKRKFETRLTQTLSTLSPWISNSLEIETFPTTACQPWTETRVKTLINPDSKEEEAKAHKAQYKILKPVDRNIVCYTDGSMLNRNIGAGTVLEMTGEAVIEATYSIDHQQEVYDAELLGILKAAQKCFEICQHNNLTKRHLDFHRQSSCHTTSQYFQTRT
jgi:hypothetical protein